MQNNLLLGEEKEKEGTVYSELLCAVERVHATVFYFDHPFVVLV